MRRCAAPALPVPSDGEVVFTRRRNHRRVSAGARSPLAAATAATLPCGCAGQRPPATSVATPQLGSSAACPPCWARGRPAS
eukprot:4422564-Alexandrium_andersonii.AAC.1